jgi:hypothetical protein
MYKFLKISSFFHKQSESGSEIKAKAGSESEEEKNISDPQHF